MKKIITENPIFVLMLGLCSALAVTTKVESAIIMGICFMIVILFSNIIISIIKNLVPSNVEIPVYILVIATLVTVLELMLQKFIPAVYTILGIYLPLIVVNCIVLGKGISVASKSSIKDSIKDAIITGLGYLFAITLIALFREVLGSGTITLLDASSSLFHQKFIIVIYKNLEILPLKIFVEPAGAFIIMGILIAIFKDKKEANHESI